jgi:tetratricopeptide (TPR) repeat protein
MNRVTQTIIAATMIVFGFVAIFFLSNYLERNTTPLPAGYADEDLALQGARIKGFALGSEGLIADWYWMKSLQYIGEKVQNVQGAVNIDDLKPLNPRLLYPYLDNASTLDPQFLGIYEYGANVLPTIDKEKAVALIQKGIMANPENWRLYHYLGYIYWKMGEYAKSAESYDKGASIKGAPSWMKSMSAKVRLDGGSRETSRAIYTQMFTEAQDEQTKESAAIRLSQLQSLDEREAIDAVLRTFRERNNRCAQNWREIFPLLQTIELPNEAGFSIDRSNNIIDPSGVPYVLNTEKCMVALNPDSKIPPN